MTYGSASMNTMIRNQHIQNIKVHTSSFTMKRVEMRMMLDNPERDREGSQRVSVSYWVKEKSILNQVQANATSKAD